MKLFARKDKRKNLDVDELRALIAAAREVNTARADDEVNKYVEKIARKISRGKFKINDKGYLCVRIWGELDFDFARAVCERLKVTGFQDADWGFDGPMPFTTDFKVKP